MGRGGGGRKFVPFRLDSISDVADLNIALDKALFSTKKYLYYSYFLMKTYVVVLIRSA